MRRLTISLDDDLADTFDRLIQEKGYQSRSEAFRDLLRGQLGVEKLDEGARFCVGTLSYMYNHHERQLASRLTSMQHEHHDVAVATLHAHLDHDNCMEAVILRGPTKSVLSFAESVMAEKGVRNGSFKPIPVTQDTHGHGKLRHIHYHPDL